MTCATLLLSGIDPTASKGEFMKSMSDSGKVEEYQGNALPTPIEYTFDYEVYENLAEAKQSENWPGDSEILKFVNQRLFTSAKAQAYQKATKPLKEAYEKSAEFKFKNLVKAAVDAGFSQEEAEAMATAKLGTSLKK